MKKIKIAVFLVGLSGGAGKVVINYFNHMPDDYQIDVITTRIESKKLLDLYKRANIKVIKIPSKRESFLKNIFSTFRILKRERYDIAYAHMTLTNCFPLYIAKLCKIKLRISHSHLAPQHKTLVERLLAFFTNKVSTDRIACGTDAGKFLYGNKSFIVLNNAIDLEEFKFDNTKRDKIRKKLKIPQTSLVIGHVGRFDEQKNHQFIIELFEKIKKDRNDSYLALIGEGHLKEKTQKKITEKGLTGSVRFIGEVDNVNDYLNVFDVFILPSLFEGLSVSAIEAQANGLPCVFSSTVSRETAIINNTYFEKLNDIENWSKRILSIKRENNSVVKKQIVLNNYEINHEAAVFDKWIKKRVRETIGIS